MSDFFGDANDSKTVRVEVPGTKKVLFLRQLPFEDWHSIAKAHWALEKANQAPDSALVARTIASCLANEDGSPLTDKSVTDSLQRSSPARVMWLYKKCWETVLKSDQETIGELEKN